MFHSYLHSPPPTVIGPGAGKFGVIGPGLDGSVGGKFGGSWSSSGGTFGVGTASFAMHCA
jgi:hypothetical protein